MRYSLLQAAVDRYFERAGIQVGGPHPWDPRVGHEGFYARLLHHGSLGLGESYMDGWWDADSPYAMLCRLLAAHLDEATHSAAEWWQEARARLLNLQAGGRSRRVIERHYDLGNELYAAMLGPSMAYSCGYWAQATDLDAAQTAKFDLVCRKLGLAPGQRVLDIGCGFGTALEYAARHYGIEGVGVTLSEEQARYARARCAGLPVEIRVQDYRSLDERFDRVFSIGMFEHVGVKNYRRYFEVARRCVAPDGLFLLHCIGAEYSTRRTDPWIEKYIFPNSMLPSVAQIGRASENLFVVEDWHNFGADYTPTLLAWLANVEAAWPRLPPHYDERFRRMWRYYLSAAAASFATRRNQLWQLVLSPHGVPGGYRRPG